MQRQLRELGFSGWRGPLGPRARGSSPFPVQRSILDTLPVSEAPEQALPSSMEGGDQKK